jgi:hypothetical protein
MRKITTMAQTWFVVAAILSAGLFLTGCNDEDTNGKNKPSALEGKILILQAYGSSSDAAGATHSFVELYNITDEAIDLRGVYLYYAAGYRANEPGFDDNVDKQWEKIALSGTIPSKGSFLILGARENETGRLIISDNYGDINDPLFTLSNRSFKAALVQADVNLPMNPFNIDGNGTKAAGYIDMVGAENDPNHAYPDRILGFETAPARNSASVAVRRKNLTDTDNNSVDFESIRYASGGISNAMMELRRPRNSTAGSWNPFAEPELPPGSAKLMILQANTYGNNNGISAGAPTGGGFPRSLVELYNNTNAAIDLTAGNYYLHIGNATAWTNVIKLEGTIPAKSSFLIVDNTTPETNNNRNTTPRALLPNADQQANFVLVNNDFAVALVRNRNTLSGNPFDDASLGNDYIDMLGCGNAIGKEGDSVTTSRPQGPRRTSLADTDNNIDDFAHSDLRGRIGTNGIDDDQLYKFWPRNSAAGEWDPITGVPAVHPVIPVLP